MACDTTTRDHSSLPHCAAAKSPRPDRPANLAHPRALKNGSRAFGRPRAGTVRQSDRAAPRSGWRPAPSRAWPTAQGLEYAVPDAAASERALPAQEREPRSKTARGGLRSQLSSISSGPRHLGLGAPRTSSRRPAEPTSQLLSGAAAVRCACCGLWREERSSKRAGRGGRCESILRQRRVAAPAGYRI